MARMEVVRKMGTKRLLTYYKSIRKTYFAREARYFCEQTQTYYYPQLGVVYACPYDNDFAIFKSEIDEIKSILNTREHVG